MPEKLTHEEFDRRVREAMKPPATQVGQSFSPAIQNLRQTARQRGSIPAKRPLPTAG